MKPTFTSALLLTLASLFVIPEPVAAAPAAESATASMLSGWGSRFSGRRTTKKVRPAKMRRSSAAKAYAKRNRRSRW